MLYGTEHDTLNRHGVGLRYGIRGLASSNPTNLWQQTSTGINYVGSAQSGISGSFTNLVLGIDSTWSIGPAGSQTNPMTLTVTAPNGAQKIFTFSKTLNSRTSTYTLAIAGVQNVAGPSSAPVQTVLAVPDGYKQIGTTSDLIARLVTVTGVINSGVVPASDLLTPSDLWAETSVITSADPNLPYIGKRETFLNLMTGKTYNFDWQEPSGGGVLQAKVEAIAPDILRAVTDVTTGGATEIVNATDPVDAVNVDRIIGASSIAAGAAVGAAFTGGATIPIIIASGVLAGAAGAAIGTVDKDPVEVIEYSLLSGSAIGIGGGAVSGLAAPVDAVGTATIAVPTDVAATTVETAGGTSLLGAAGGAATAVLGKAAVAIGVSALTAEVKKLTGIGGGVVPPSQAPSLTINQVAPTAASTSTSTAVKWVLGGLAAVALLKK